MMQVQSPLEQLFFTTVRIESILKDGQSFGTASIFSYPYENSNALFLVTNKHVIANAYITRFFFTATEDGQHPNIGERFDIEISNLQWHGHPSPDIDVAVTPLVPILSESSKTEKYPFFKSITLSIIPNLEQLNTLDAVESVTFVGYPNGIFDEVNLLPILRRGVTATPLQIDYNGEPTFLIDASVFPGSSGSPVFICDNGGYSSRGNFTVGSRAFFLGIIAKVLVRSERGQIGFVPIPTTQMQPVLMTQQMIDLGIVYKASTVVETIQDFLICHQQDADNTSVQSQAASGDEDRIV